MASWWRWPRAQDVAPYQPEERSAIWSVGDPAIAEMLFGGTPTYSGVSVNETSAMGLSTVYRCVQLISGTVATLPLRTVRTMPDGTTQRAPSWLDDPGGVDGPTTHEWVEGVVISLLLSGNWYGLKILGGAGQLLALQAIPSQSVGVEVKNGRKVYHLQLDNGKTLDLTDREVVHIPGLSLDGVKGVSPIQIARNSLGVSIAGEKSAARMFGNGALLSGLVTPEDDLTEDDAKAIKDSLRQKMQGTDNAGDVAVINRKLKFTPWSMNASDAQWLESRAFQVTEVARWFGCPPHLVGDVERSTSWGTGIREQTLGWQKFTLQQWTSRIEARLSRQLGPDLKVEFDYRQLLSGTPDQEIDLLLQQVVAGVLTADEARAILNRPPLTRSEQPQPQPQPEAAA